MLVAPDTSPRGHDAIEGEDDHWDFGTGAGFYVNATEEKWSKNYNMFNYVTVELPKLIADNFPCAKRDAQSITVCMSISMRVANLLSFLVIIFCEQCYDEFLLAVLFFCRVIAWAVTEHWCAR